MKAIAPQSDTSPLAKEYHQFVEENGHPPTYYEVANEMPHSPKLYQRYFGVDRWSEVATAAGYRSKHLCLIEALARFARSPRNWKKPEHIVEQYCPSHIIAQDVGRYLKRCSEEPTDGMVAEKWRDVRLPSWKVSFVDADAGDEDGDGSA